MEMKLLTIPPESNFSAPAIESLKSKLPVRSLKIELAMSCRVLVAWLEIRNMAFEVHVTVYR